MVGLAMPSTLIHSAICYTLGAISHSDHCAHNLFRLHATLSTAPTYDFPLTSSSRSTVVTRKLRLWCGSREYDEVSSRYDIIHRAMTVGFHLIINLFG
jgi:hypothetical protein